MSKVKFDANTEAAYEANLKTLQGKSYPGGH